MGSDLQKECEECCRFEEREDIEVKKDLPNILKNAKNISQGDNGKDSKVKSDLTFIDNNPYIATLIITNPKIYEKMNKGERLHRILEPLTSFLNKNLFETLNQLLNKIIEIQKNSSFKNNVYVLFEKTYRDLINNKVIENMMNSDLGYFSKIKFNLLYTIEIIAELFHYFNYHLSNENAPYNINYWEYVKNPVSYMKEKIYEFKKCIEEMNNFIIDTKSKNLNHSVDIHITSSNFKIQMEQ